MLLSIVFSFRNEERNIPELVRRVTAALAGIGRLRHELIFVDDASTDASVDVLTDLQARHPITIITMARRFGPSPCVLAGFAHARGDAVIYMDSDLQDPPEVIPEMIERFRDGAEVVHTTRTKRHGERAAKLWVTKRAYRLINAFSDVHLPENTGDFKLLSRKVVEMMLSFPERDPYLRGLSVWIGFRQDVVRYERQARFEGVTHFPLFGPGPLREFLRGLTSFSTAPLYFGLYFGVATIVVSGLLVIYALVTKFLGVAAQGASGVLVAVAFFNGVVLMTTGLIGLYVARIHEEIKGRPKYIIKNVSDRS